jgi:hypothetical protein
MSDLVLRLTTKVATQAQELATISEALKITKQEAEDAKNKLIELTSSSSIKPLSSSSSSSSSLSKSLLSHSKKTKEALIQEINNYENKLKSKSSQITKLINELGMIISFIYCFTYNILIILDIKNKSYNNLEKNYNDLLYSNMKLTANGNSNIDIDKLIKELDDSKALIESLKKDVKIMKVAEEESSMKMKLLEDAIMLKTNDISNIGKL